MTGENAVNTVMSAFLGTAISLYAVDQATIARVGGWLYVCLFVLLLGAILAGISINIIANCWFNVRICRRTDPNYTNHQLRLAKNVAVFLITILIFALFSGISYKTYNANLFDTYGWVILFSLLIWLLSLVILNHIGAKSPHLETHKQGLNP